MNNLHKFYRKNQNLLVGTLAFLLLLFLVFSSHWGKKKILPSAPFVLTAVYNKADGLNVGAPVRLSGVEVAKVSNITLDEFFRVRATMSFPTKIDLPADSGAIIETDGIIGNKYIELSLGGDDELMENGDTFMYPQDALLLDELLDRFLTYIRNKKGVLTTTEEGDES